MTLQNQLNKFALSEDSDQPVHPPNPISLRCVAQWVTMVRSFHHADSQDSDQALRL